MSEDAEDKGKLDREEEKIMCEQCGSTDTYTDVRLPRRDGNAYLAGSHATICLECGHITRTTFPDAGKYIG